jgi:hypothetical protein
MSVSSILSVETLNDLIYINLKIENDKSIEDLSAFFDSLAGVEIIMFIGFYNTKVYANEVISSTVLFSHSHISKSSLILEFEKVETI